MTEHDKHSTKPTGRLSSREADVLLEHLSQGIAQGVPLDEVFLALSDDMPNRRLQAVARQLGKQLAAGADLATSLESVQSLIPNHLRRALSIGAESGNLSAILSGLAESELARRQMQRGLRAVMVYPLIILTLLTLLLIYVSIFLQPMFQDIYADFGLDLPDITVFMYRILRALPTVVIVIVAVFGGSLLLGLLSYGSRFVHWVRTALPLVGRAWLWSGQHEFAALMGTLTGHNVTTTEALACTAESLRDRNVARATRILIDKCERGMPLSRSMRESIHFDRTLTSLVEWGETQNKLPAAFQEAAHTYSRQMEQYTRFLGRVVHPMMLFFAAPILLFIIMALFLPLVELINGLT